mmetsp:Transcript_23875/g.42992  ORF Transcript_23875/g.42992 Transcript_23875/m.42992 type:complete len:227 (-) Transcript_23875:1304-1984(-)
MLRLMTVCKEMVARLDRIEANMDGHVDGSRHGVAPEGRVHLDAINVRHQHARRVDVERMISGQDRPRLARSGRDPSVRVGGRAETIVDSEPKRVPRNLFYLRLENLKEGEAYFHLQGDRLGVDGLNFSQGLEIVGIFRQFHSIDERVGRHIRVDGVDRNGRHDLLDIPGYGWKGTGFSQSGHGVVSWRIEASQKIDPPTRLYVHDLDFFRLRRGKTVVGKDHKCNI